MISYYPEQNFLCQIVSSEGSPKQSGFVLKKIRCGRSDIEDLAFGCRKLILVIHESRLLQMRGAGYEAVVLHRECPATKQML
jgi:hypothetical protein